MSNELIEKVLTTATVSADQGGLLNPEQADRFIDYMWDATVLAKEGRTIRMKSDTVDIDKVAVGQRITRLATEAVDDGVNVDPTFTKISITTKKLRLDWELSAESLEDNLEGEALEDHIARMMATQMGNDIEDLAINGDTALTGDALLKSFNGFHKLALASGHVVSGAGHTLSGTGAGDGKALFNAAIKAMPRKYLQRRNQLRFYAGSNLTQDYIYGLTQLSVTPEAIAADVIRGNPEAPGSFRSLAFGIPVVEVPLFTETLDGTYSGETGDHGYVELTFPQNRVWGVKREVKVVAEYAPKKDTVEYTAYVRVGVQIENEDAYVTVKDVKVAS